MKSPFFWQNLGLVFLIAANFACSVWWVSDPGANQSMPIALRIGLRTLSVAYATASCLVLTFAVMQFHDAELSKEAQACWKRRRDWPHVHAGMTKKQVLEILGPASRNDVWYDLDRNSYKLHPLDLECSSSVSYSIVSAEEIDEGKVVEKYPADEQVVEQDSSWWPIVESRNYLTLKDRFVRTALAFSFIGILLLAVVSLLPFWPCTDWHSLSLYFPAAASVLCVFYESGQKGGWRCDAILLLPAYAVILTVWLFRVIQVAHT